MKTRHISILAATGMAAVGAVGFMTVSREPALVVHEWGTFTSLQGSDGVPLKWNPLESSQLPNFVYNWSRAGFGRYPTGMLALGTKQALVTYQRMETPVIYFYTAKEIALDLTVRLPNGGITEWYPQAAEVGPSRYPETPALARLDNGLHQCGVSSSFTLSSILDFRSVKESLIHWAGVRILPAEGHPEIAATLRDESSGSHYFAARETDSAYVQVPKAWPTNSGPEYEKFLFYRGVGNFLAPLSVKMEREGTVQVCNQGRGTIAHAFILGINGDRGNFVCLDNLKPGERKETSLEVQRQGHPITAVRQQIQLAMEQALSAEGLYSREAAAMVKTWENSWFTEPGVRVLYLLPRAWTDETLPMDIQPKPFRLVRVMVGRAELVTPETERKLALEITEAKSHGAAAQAQIQATVAQLGRFAQPVFEQAVEHAKLEPTDRARVEEMWYRSRTALRP
jgi:hypothetical protein